MFVAGIDIGYSQVKIACGEAVGEPTTHVLPALAAPAEHVAERIEGTSAQPAGEIVVPVRGETWIAGVQPTQLGTWQRALHEDYVASPSWEALALAALATISPQVPIACLVAGLPVAQASDQARREAVRARLNGVHRLPSGPVEVRDVRVIAQPIGTFVDLLVNAPDHVVEQIDSGTVLVLDVGFFSVDWSVLVRGDLRHASSGTSLEAMSVLLDTAAYLVASDHGGKPPVASVESALTEGQGYIWSRGTRIDLACYLQLAVERTAPQALEALRRSLRREHMSVDMVVLTGGGSRLFEPLVRELFPDVPLMTPRDPVVSNALGYFHYAAR